MINTLLFISVSMMAMATATSVPKMKYRVLSITRVPGGPQRLVQAVEEKGEVLVDRVGPRAAENTAFKVVVLKDQNQPGHGEVAEQQQEDDAGDSKGV